jgi:hypothetical protein
MSGGFGLEWVCFGRFCVKTVGALVYRCCIEFIYFIDF